jgi:nucleoside-diphosphate-sugar epimerase
MNILLTGATGFVGKKGVESLKNKKIFDNTVLFSARPLNDAKWLDSKDDKFDNDYLVNNYPEIDTIIHIGAFTPKSGQEANDVLNSTSNIINTDRLLCAATRLTNLKKIIYISTLDVYKETDDELHETASTIPNTMYGWSKLYCEKMVTCYSEQRGIKYIILRLGHVFGEGEEKYKKVLPTMIDSAINKRSITIFGDGEALRTFIYVDDVAKAIVNSIDFDFNGIINVVGGESISINKLANMIVELSGNEIAVNHAYSDFKNRNITFDNSKLMCSLLSELTPLEEGIKKEMAYMKNFDRCI